jgi:ubiquitin-activating enzyme E1
MDEDKQPAFTDLMPNLAENLCSFAQCQLAPFSGFWGGIVAQEVVKYTGKYTPIR